MPVGASAYEGGPVASIKAMEMLPSQSTSNPSSGRKRRRGGALSGDLGLTPSANETYKAARRHLP